MPVKALYSSNWGYQGSARAANVVQYLIEVNGLSPSKLSLAGYGEYKNKAPK